MDVKGLRMEDKVNRMERADTDTDGGKKGDRDENRQRQSEPDESQRAASITRSCVTG